MNFEQSKSLYSKRSPCNTCPYRKDVPQATWHYTEYIKLLQSEEDFIGNVFQCHKKDGRVCIGWLIDQVKRKLPSIALRLSLSVNRVEDTYLDSLTCTSALYEDIKEMCHANYPEIFTYQKLYMEGRITAPLITQLGLDEVFAFGSNKQGVHGKAAAKTALQWGAQKGKGNGYYGRTYAIPTRNYHGLGKFTNLPLDEIREYVTEYIDFCANMDYRKFKTTAIGCGNAGYTPEQIAPMFRAAIKIKNIHLPQSFWDVLLKDGI